MKKYRIQISLFFWFIVYTNIITSVTEKMTMYAYEIEFFLTNRIPHDTAR